MDATAPAEGARRPAPEVSTRNFAKPLRLSPEALASAQLRIRRALLPLDRHFERALRRPHDLEVVQVAEANAGALFRDLQEPFVIARFDVGGQPGWLVWEVEGALAAAEIMLGAVEPTSQEARACSTLERRCVQRLMAPMVEAVCSAMGLQARGIEVVRTTDEVGSWSDGGPGAQPRRLSVHLAFDGPGGSSGLDLYLPGIEPAGDGPAPDRAAPLPGYLAGVAVNVAARLGANQIPLADLLSIEVGDVIPLAAPIDEPLRIYVEDVPHPCGRGHLGSKHGNLAIRLEQIGLEDEEN